MTKGGERSRQTPSEPKFDTNIEITGWGRYPRYSTLLRVPSNLSNLQNYMNECAGLIARGNGRAYGDSAIGKQITLSVKQMNRIRHFDRFAGIITVEAGMLLADLISVIMPYGFFPPVVPGTKFVTIGGMIASDVHGKNHHLEGGISNHIEGFKIALPDGLIVECSRYQNREFFEATVGGMGLTGTIIDVTLKLKMIETGWLTQTTTVASDLATAMKLLSEKQDSTYSVAWIDCLARGSSLGRSLIYAAEHAKLAELHDFNPDATRFPKCRTQSLSIPIEFPNFTLNRYTVSAFNEIYFRLGAAKAHRPMLVEWDPYFFPLDGIGDWNRLYGNRGFVQYQCVIPTLSSYDVLSEILERVSSEFSASFLAVLKQLGTSNGLLSFPIKGYTLTLDLPVNPRVFRLLDELDKLVVNSGGRLYLAKDARQSLETFQATYPNYQRFKDFRRAILAESRISSMQSKRLCL